jgi:S-DNA-T family DNA segregation ATPase FtsK/SpoIIIE
MRELLEYQSDRIEAVLAKQEAPGRITGGAVTPHRIRFEVLPAAIGARIPTIEGLAEELAAALDAPEVRVVWRGAAMQVEVPREDPRPVLLLPLLRGLRNVPPVTAVLGVADDGAPLMVRLPSPEVGHVLAAGAPGAGKTALLRTMALSLALRHPHRRELGLVLVGQDLGDLGALPQSTRSVVVRVEEALEASESLVRLMERREQQGESEPPVIVFVDELTDLTVVGGSEAERRSTQLLQWGREVGIHVVAATAQPTGLAGLLGDGLFPVRVVGKVADVEEARVASGWRGTGAERLLGQGDFVAVAEGRLFRFQAAYVSPGEMAEAAGALQQERRRVAAPESTVIAAPGPLGS